MVEGVEIKISITQKDKSGKRSTQKTSESAGGAGYAESSGGTGYTSGESNLVSNVGVLRAQSHQKQKRRRVKLPRGTDAPFEPSYDRLNALRFGGMKKYQIPLGFKENRVNKMGYKGDDIYSESPFPTALSYRQSKQKDKREKEEMQQGIKNLFEYQKLPYDPKSFKAGAKIPKRIGGAAKNPEAEVGRILTRVLGGAGPYGAAAIAAITAIIAAPETVKAIIKVLGVKGAPLNSDWHRQISDETIAFFSLEDQKLRALGRESFTVGLDNGFRPVEGTNSYNSLFRRDEDRLARTGQDAKSKGLA